MNIIRFISFLSCFMTLVSCSSVRLAVYDYEKRHEYAVESKAAFVNSPIGKEKTAKASFTQEADKYIGTPYKYGSCDVKKGFDCSGFVYTVAKAQDLKLPRSSGLMAASGKHIPWKKAEQGDLVFFGEKNKIHQIGHVGIVEKNKGNQLWVIHATCNGGVIKENVLASPYWKKRILFAMDVINPGKVKS
jgi:cell wall-associated NlpC family hydrolase